MKIYDALVHIKENGPLSKGHGICSNLNNLCDQNGYKFVENNSIGWKHFSGNKAYPLPLVNGIYYTDNMWDKRTKMGKLRYDLLDYLIEKAKEKGV